MLRPSSDYLPAAEIDAAPAHYDSGLRTVDLVEMVRILRRRLSLIAAIAGAFTAAALLYVLSATTQYTATSTVLVDPRRANVVETTQTVLSNFGTDDATIESQTLLIKSVRDPAQGRGPHEARHRRRVRAAAVAARHDQGIVPLLVLLRPPSARRTPRRAAPPTRCSGN